MLLRRSDRHTDERFSGILGVFVVCATVCGGSEKTGSRTADLARRKRPLGVQTGAERSMVTHVLAVVRSAVPDLDRELGIGGVNVT